MRVRPGLVVDGVDQLLVGDGVSDHLDRVQPLITASLRRRARLRDGLLLGSVGLEGPGGFERRQLLVFLPGLHQGVLRRVEEASLFGAAGCGRSLRPGVAGALVSLGLFLR